MFDTNASEPVMLQYIGQNTGDNEQVVLIIQSGVWSSLSQPSQYYSGIPAWELAPSGADQRYAGSSNPFPAGGFRIVPHSMFAYNKWIDIILHVHWSQYTTGAVEAWAKPDGSSSWSNTVPLTSGFPTLDYLSSAGPNSIDQYSKYDNIGAYTAGPFSSVGDWTYNNLFAAGSSFSAVAGAFG
jgi:hypothetical protein